MTAKVGRPSKYTVALGAEICRRLAEGESLRAICATKGGPSRSAVRRWLAENSEFRSLHTVARDFMVDSLAEEALDMARTATNANAAAHRLYIDTIKWYVGKVAPKKYGDKLDMNITGQVSIGDAIEEGRRRVARMRGAGGGA